MSVDIKCINIMTCTQYKLEKLTEYISIVAIYSLKTTEIITNGYCKSANINKQL